MDSPWPLVRDYLLSGTTIALKAIEESEIAASNRFGESQPLHLNREINQVKKVISKSIRERMSASMILFPCYITRGFDEFETIRWALRRQYDDTTETDTGSNTSIPMGSNIPIASINCALYDNDESVLIALVNQLLNRPLGNHSTYNTTMLEFIKFLEICCLNGYPAILIFNNIQELATYKKQVMFYTLLDLMHKNNLLFVVSIHLIILLSFFVN